MMTASTAGKVHGTDVSTIAVAEILERLLRYLATRYRPVALPAQPSGLRVPHRVWRRNAALLVHARDRQGR